MSQDPSFITTTRPLPSFPWPPDLRQDLAEVGLLFCRGRRSGRPQVSGMPVKCYHYAPGPSAESVCGADGRPDKLGTSASGRSRDARESTSSKSEQSI